MVALSVLDLSPIPEGADAAQAFRNTVELARHVERLGFHRYWLAEHHNMAGIGSAATAVLIGHVAGATATIRVGAGGIMLPNHAPLVIAEQFGTLESLYPGSDRPRHRARTGDRPDDLARASGARSPATSTTFPRDVVELQSYFQPAPPGRSACARYRATASTCRSGSWAPVSSARSSRPRSGSPMPSPRTSRPSALMQAIQVYRGEFRPSEQCAARLT